MSPTSTDSSGDLIRLNNARLDLDDADITLPGEVRSVAANRELTLTLTLPEQYRSESDGSRAIIFDNNRYGVSVYVNGELIYTVNNSSLKEQLRFTDYQIIPLPAYTEKVVLTFSGSSGGVYSLPAIRFGSVSSARYTVLSRELVTAFLLGVFMILLLIICIAGVIMNRKKHFDSRFNHLAIFLALAMLWGWTDSYLPVLTSIPQEIVGLLCYISFMALPLPICRFVWVTRGRRSSLLTVINAVGAVNIILQVVLSSLGLIRLNRTFYFTHFIIAAVVIYCMLSMLKMWQEAPSRENTALLTGSTVLAAMTVLSLGLYFTIGGASYRIGVLLGAIVFVGLLVLSIIFRMEDTMQSRMLALKELEIHERLTYVDTLTGLGSRRAFDKYLKELDTAPEGQNAVLIIMDVNGLKLTNDLYGRAAGNDLVCAAASAVDRIYGELGQLFRISGDEFAVVLTDPAANLVRLDEDLLAEIAQRNRTSLWKIALARGTSYRLHSNGKVLSISDWKQEADVNMYRSKVAMTGDQDRNRARDLREIIHCIIATVEAKDDYTASHSARVRELSIALGSRLGLSNATLNELETAAYLHDIGKIGVPDRVLLKPDRLTNEEFDLMKRHPAIGAQIIGHAQSMQYVAEIVLHHHERWDGRGYPAGLAGADIPLGSRIIAVADSIDAMTSRRVYRDCMSLDECRAEIERNIGTMYDPTVAGVALENWQEIESIVLLHPKRLQGAEQKGNGALPNLRRIDPPVYTPLSKHSKKIQKQPGA